MYGNYTGLETLKGKEIDNIQFDEWDQSLLIHFTDKTVLIILSERFNATGSRLITQVLKPRIEFPSKSS